MQGRDVGRLAARDLLGAGASSSTTVTIPNIVAQVQVNTCAKVKDDFTFAASALHGQSTTNLTLKAGICICADATTTAGLSSGVDAHAQIVGTGGVLLTGSLADELALDVRSPNERESTLTGLS